MTGINSIGGASGGFDPNHGKSPEERRAKAEQLKEERKKKREETAAKENVDKGVKDARDDLKGFWTDNEGNERVDTRA